MRKLALALLGLYAAGAVAQQKPGGDSLKPFIGTWKAKCADGKDFVIVTLVPAGGSGTLEGTIQLANMRGADDGRCQAVVDPPSERHALKVTDARRQGSVLAFKGSRRMEFEMTVPGNDRARLKFIGTASEDNPWELKRTN